MVHRAFALVAALGFASTLGSAYSAKPSYVATDFKATNSAKLTHGQSFTSPALASPVAFAIGVAAITGPLVIVTAAIYTATRPLPGGNAVAQKTMTAERLAKLDA